MLFTIKVNGVGRAVDDDTPHMPWWCAGTADCPA